MKTGINLKASREASKQVPDLRRIVTSQLDTYIYTSTTRYHLCYFLSYCIPLPENKKNDLDNALEQMHNH